jgi:hypothetical protein
MSDYKKMLDDISALKQHILVKIADATDDNDRIYLRYQLALARLQEQMVLDNQNGTPRSIIVEATAMAIGNFVAGAICGLQTEDNTSLNVFGAVLNAQIYNCLSGKVAEFKPKASENNLH